jgi:hypothetical protein
MNKRLLMLAAASTLVVAACGDNNNNGGGANSSMPTNFTSFVNGAVGTQPADAKPVQTGSLGNLGLDNTQAFANVQFTGGDTIPAGVYSAAAACANAGASACSPGLH